MKPLGLERRVRLYAWLAGLPASIVALVAIWTRNADSGGRWALTVLICLFWVGFSAATGGLVSFPLRTLSNVLAAIREGDYSMRARGSRRDDALGEVFRELNALVDNMHEQRLGAMEATALLRTVVNEIDVAVFSFDSAERLCLANRTAERLLARPREQLLGDTAADLALRECLEGDTPRIISKTFPEKAGRWEIRRSVFRQDGMPHRLLVISDISRALRDEERHTWRRLIRVLGHELNNSLAPLKSVAESLRDLLGRRELPDDWRDDMAQGLALIASRSAALSRFVDGYARLAKLPPPRPSPLEVGLWVRRAAGLEQRLPVKVLEGPPVSIRADAGQLEQLLINLVRNAADASLETGGGVQMGWRSNGESIEVFVRDEGPGLSNPANVFIPFFTTKPGGSGIGLVLSREIAEAHGGSLVLENRVPGPGAEARLRLPLSNSQAQE
ncbi:MAG TPA: ATP-binding protein [Candidatus Acidoferrales bacterium]|nr:ATP-binding protein [Candidatus Acidoferrales bacterium]